MRIKIENEGDIRQTRIGDAEVMDAQFVPHKSGKFFIRYLYKDFLDLLIEDMRRNVAQKYDNVILATGGEGSGKSSIMYWLCEKYDPANFDIRESYTWNMDAFRERFASGDYGNGIFWLDETTQVASNREWQSDDNKDLVSILETFRSKRFLFAGCAPKLERVDVYLRDFRMRYQIICKPMTFAKYGFKKRGYFELKKRNDETMEMDHVGYGMYDPMPAEIEEIYEPLKEEFQERKRKEIAERKLGQGAKYKTMYDNERKRITGILVELHDRKLVDDAVLMDLFGYDNRGTYQNVLSRARRYKDDD